MATQIRILESELNNAHFAFERGATSNTWYHAINNSSKRIFTIVQRNGAWCEVRGNGGFKVEYIDERYPSYSTCLESLFAKHGIKYNPNLEQEDQTSTLAPQRRNKKQQDEFGFSFNSKAHLFCEHLAACGSRGTTMNDVVNVKWNTDKSIFHWVLARLIKDGKAIKKGKQMYLLSAMENQPPIPTPIKRKPHPVAMPTKPPPVSGKRKPHPV